MANTKKEAPETTAQSVPQYTSEELCENSVALFGKKREVVIGALHFKFKGGKQRFTIGETQEAINDFLKKEAKNNVKR